MPDPLREAVERLAPYLEQTLLLAADAGAERQAARLERLRKLFDSRLRHLDTLSRPPLVAVIGGTNVGKSTIANLLLGRPLGLPCPTAVGTKAVGLAVPAEAAPAFGDASFLPWFDKRPWTAPEPLNEPFDGDRPRLYLQLFEAGPRVALADTPDIDATLERNHRTTEDVFLLADAVIYVTTPTKYADEACVEYLARAARYGKAVWVIYNRGESDGAGFRDLVDNLLPAEGLPRDTPVLAVPFRQAIETAEGPWRAELAALLPDLAARGPAIVHRAAVGTAAGLAAEYGGLLDHLQGEVAAVDGWLGRARQATAREAERYAHRMPPLPHDVLDEAVLAVLRELRVPVVDWVYEKLGAILAPVRRAARQAVAAVQRLVGRPPRSPFEAEQAWRLEEQVRALHSLAQLYAELLGLVDECPTALRPPLQARLRNAVSSDYEPAVAGFVEQVEGLRRTMAEEAKQSILSGLQEKRWQIVGLKVGKATARGLSIYLVVHSAGLTHEDLVLAPAADAVCKAIIDHLLGRRSREDLEREVAARRQAQFAAFLGEVLLADLEANLPASHRAGFVAEARAAAADLATAAEARA